MRLDRRDIEHLLSAKDIELFAARFHSLVSPRTKVSAGGFVPIGTVSAVPNNNALMFSDGFADPEWLRRGWALLPDMHVLQWIFMNLHRAGNTYEYSVQNPSMAAHPYYKEFAEPADIFHGIAAAIGSLRRPLGLLAMARSSKSHRFCTTQLRFVATVRDHVEAHLETLLRPLIVDRLDKIVDTIAATAPRPMFLFNRCGRLMWLSELARLRLSESSHKRGPYFAYGGDWGLFGALYNCVKKTAKCRLDGQVAAHQARTVMRAGEKLLIRDDVQHIMLEIAHSEDNSIAPSGAVTLLTPTERRVATLRADGYSVANIAQILERSEHTIHTHLKNIRRKLGVHNIVDLRLALHG